MQNTIKSKQIGIANAQIDMGKYRIQKKVLDA